MNDDEVVVVVVVGTAEIGVLSAVTGAAAAGLLLPQSPLNGEYDLPLGDDVDDDQEVGAVGAKGIGALDVITGAAAGLAPTLLGAPPQVDGQ